MLLCTFILLLTMLLLVRNALAGQRDGELCAVLFYARSFLYFLYDTSKLSTLIHFNYLMYHSYKASEVILRTKSILFKYVTLIVILSIIFSATLILVDIFVSRTAFKIIHGRCTLLIDLSNYGNISIVLYFVELSILNVVETGFMIIGLVLYYLTTRQCCSKVTRDVKISIALNSTIGITSFLVIVLHCRQVEGDVNVTISTTCLFFEQLLLFCVFVTSSKVLNH